MKFLFVFVLVQVSVASNFHSHFDSLSFEATGRGHSSSWLYRGTIFGENNDFVILIDELLLQKPNRQFLYLQGEDSAYVNYGTGNSWECMNPYQIPPLLELVGDNPAEHVPHQLVSEEFSRDCTQGDFYLHEFTGETYLLCVNNITKKAEFLVGMEFRATFHQIEKPRSRFVETLPNFKCKGSLYQSLSKAKFNSSERQSWWKRFQYKQGVRQQQKHCIFIHGSGESGFGLVTDTFQEYWGDLHLFTKQCLSHQFLHMETITLGWDSAVLHKNVCSVGTFDQPPSDKFFIRNKIIFAHSMGNLILAAAVFNNVCGIDLNSTTWYAASKPANGSVVANQLPSVCADSGLEKQIAILDGACVNNKAGEAYITLQPSYPGLPLLYPILKKYITGSMCGTDAGGLVSQYSPALVLISKLGKLQLPNDGMVWYQSCFIPTNGIVPGDNPSSLFYNAAINHADGTCRNGDGWWGDARKPCSWYQYRT